MENSLTSDPLLTRYLRQFSESVDQTREARQRAELYRDYYDGKQWTPAEVATLQSRLQPCITDNRIKDKVDHLLGLERQTRTDPKAYPRNPQDDGAADAATDALRYVSDCNDFPQTKSRAFENILIEGFGGCEVVVDDKGYSGAGPKKQVKIRGVRWDRIYYDPHSLLPDFRDAEYMGIVLWMDLSRAKVKYPQLSANFDKMVEGTMQRSDETYDDKPDMWVDRARKRVQILEHYDRSRTGKWERTVFSRAGFVEKPAECVYKDEFGEPECPLILQSGYVDRKGERYGVVRRYKDLQDEINKRRSKALHLMSNNRVITEQGAVEDVEKTRKEVARPDGVAVVTPGMRFDVVENQDLVSGQFLLLQDAIAALSITGPNAALQGEMSDQSGRSQQIAQQAGAIQLGTMFDGIRYWQKRVMCASWNRVRQFWTDETWIRVTDDEKTHFVALNRPMTVGEIEAEKLNGAQMSDQQKQERLMALASDPMARTQVVQNNVAEMHMDIIIDEAPDTVTLQQEQWLQLTELAKSGFPIKPTTLIRASSIRNKEQLIDEVESQQQGLPPQVMEQVQAAMQEVAKQKEAVEAEQDRLKDIQTQIKEGLSALKVEQAELEATRKIFAAEQRVAESQIKAAAVTANAQVQTKQVQAQASLQTKQTQFDAKRKQAQVQDRARQRGNPR